MDDRRPTQAAAPPGGSAHSAVEAPRSNRGKIGLIAIVGLIVAILLVALLFANDAPELGDPTGTATEDGSVVIVPDGATAAPEVTVEQ